VFDTAANGDQCAFSWIFEYNGTGSTFLRSPTSDTLGICLDHSKYMYDSNNDGTPDTTWPQCTTLGIGSNVNGGHDAVEFGCVDTATATAHGQPPSARTVPLDVRLPYHRVAQPAD